MTRFVEVKNAIPACVVLALCLARCAHANESQIASSSMPPPAGEVIATAPMTEQQAATEPAVPTSQPVERVLKQRPTAAQLQQAINEVLAQPALSRARFSLLVVPLRKRRLIAPASQPASQPAVQPAVQPASRPAASQEQPAAASQPASQPAVQPLIAIAPDVARVPASNAKLLTTTAALRVLGRRYRFDTEVGWRGSRVYIRGRGDPLLSRSDLLRLARAVRARGVSAVSTVVVDDSYYDKRQLAPGFESFHEGSYYRPTSSALNVDDNAVLIKISAPRQRRHPRIDVLPPSDYVKVRKLIRFIRPGKHKRKARSKRHVAVKMRRRGSIMWLTVSGRIDRRTPTFTTRRAVYDPAFNVGWAFRRALVEAGVKLNGSVMRGRWPKGLRPIARRAHGLLDVLRATNTHSNNLAAENLVRAMGKRVALQQASESTGRRRRRALNTWKLGLQRLEQELTDFGIDGFRLGNGSGLHRGSRASVRALCTLLQKIYDDPQLRAALLPTLAVAGRSGTLSRRLRGTAAEGLIAAKTGTLAGALALSGYVDPDGDQPLAFSILVNGRSDRMVKEAIDSIAVLLARYVRGRPLDVEPEPESQPQS